MHMKNTKKKAFTGLLICIFLIAALFLGGKLLFYHVSDAENTADAETAAGRAGGYESPSGGGARRRAAEAG